MKKLIVFVLVLALSLSLFACGNGGTGTDTSTPAADNSSPASDVSQAPAQIPSNFTVPDVGYDGSEITVKFYHTMGSNLSDVLDAYIVEFNKLYPNITIAYEKVGGYDDVRDQISTEISYKTQPNMAYCYPDHVALYNLAGAVATLDTLIDSKIEVTRADGTTEILGLTDEQKEDFIKGYYEEGRQFGDGAMYTMPFSKSTEVLYYDKTFFDANGLTPPKTWDEMETICAKLKELDPNCIPFGYDSEANWFITMCEQYKSPYTSATGDHYLFNNETNRAFVKRFHDWYQNGWVTTQKLYGSYTSGLFTSTNGIRCYMCIGSSAGATHQRPAKNDDGTYPFEVGITSIPQVDQNNQKIISQGPSICIFNKDNPQEVVASWLFLKYLITSVEFQAEFSMASGYVPVIQSVAENPTYAAFVAKADGGNYISALSAKVCLEQKEYYYTSPAFNGSSTARDQVGAIISKCIAESNASDIDAFIEEAFEDAVDECEYHG